MNSKIFSFLATLFLVTSAFADSADLSKAVIGTYTNDGGCTANIWQSPRFGTTIQFDKSTDESRQVDFITVIGQAADIELCKDAHLAATVSVKSLDNGQTEYTASCSGSPAKVAFTFVIDSDGKLVSGNTVREIFKGPLSNINSKQVIVCEGLALQKAN